MKVSFHVSRRTAGRAQSLISEIVARTAIRSKSPIGGAVERGEMTDSGKPQASGERDD